MSGAEEMVLVDTSSWTHSLREEGDENVRLRLHELLVSGRAVSCEMVRLELWSGVRGGAEKKRLAEIDAELRLLPIDQVVWDQARQLAIKARALGVTVPNTDLLIFACARAHGAGIEAADKHFGMLERVAENDGTSKPRK